MSVIGFSEIININEFNKRPNKRMIHLPIIWQHAFFTIWKNAQLAASGTDFDVDIYTKENFSRQLDG